MNSLVGSCAGGADIAVYVGDLGGAYIQTPERFLHLLPNTQDGWIAERGPRSSHRIV